MEEIQKLQKEIQTLKETVDFNVAQNMRLIKKNYEYFKFLNELPNTLSNVNQLISGWKQTTPKHEWTEFDETCLNELIAIQSELILLLK